MKSLEFYKNKTTDALEDTLVSKNESTRTETLEKNITDIFSKESSKYLRLTALLSITKGLVPKNANRKTKKFTL